MEEHLKNEYNEHDVHLDTDLSRIPEGHWMCSRCGRINLMPENQGHYPIKGINRFHCPCENWHNPWG